MDKRFLDACESLEIIWNNDKGRLPFRCFYSLINNQDYKKSYTSIDNLLGFIFPRIGSPGDYKTDVNSMIWSVGMNICTFVALKNAKSYSCCFQFHFIQYVYPQLIEPVFQ